jgi:hypothetical protein
MMAALLPGWSIEPWHKISEIEPVLRFGFEEHEYFVTGPWVPKSTNRRDPVDAACGFIAELIRAYVNEIPNWLCLHAAAAEIGGRLVVFPSTHRAGKSILSAAMAAAGCRLAGDDILLVDAQSGCGISGGFCPRLRLPLPDNLKAETRAFIEANSGPTGKRYGYLTLDENRLARKGERAPIGTFVLLERADAGEARLEAIGHADALKTVIWQNFARREPSTFIIERLYGLVRRTGAYRLIYSRPDDAVRLLQEQFANWPEAETENNLQSGQSIEPKLPSGPTDAQPADAYRRNGRVAELEIDGQRFLADDETGQITLLNETASAIWHVLTEPMAEGEIVELMALAFPEIDIATITNDVRASLNILAEAGLVFAPGA